MERERGRRSWADRPRAQSYHGEELVRPDVAARQQNAATKQHRAALEALFEPKPPPTREQNHGAEPDGEPDARIVESPQPTAPVSQKRQELLRKLSVAQRSKAISDIVDAFLKGGFEFPEDQEVFLQILEHRDEARVRDAIEQLDRLLNRQLPVRRPVLVQRLKRIEDTAEEGATRAAATGLRRRVG